MSGEYPPYGNVPATPPGGEIVPYGQQSPYGGANPFASGGYASGPYGSPYGSANPYAGAVPQRGNGMAVAALVLGIWGFCTTWIPFFIGIILGALPDLLAVIFGIVGIVKANEGRGGMGMAITGLILGAISGFSILFGAGTIW